MKLNYRGIRYEHTPNPVPQLDRVLGQGHYRGVSITLRAVTALPKQPAADLVYRGVAYRNDSRLAAPAEVPVISILAVTAAH